MPLRSGGTTPRPTRAMAGLAMPMPKPESSIPGMRDRPARVGPHREQRSDASSRYGDAATEHGARRKCADRRAEDEWYGEGEDRHRQEAQPAAERRVTEVVLQIQSEIRHQCEHSAADGEGAERDAAEAGFAKEREVEHWPVLVEFDEDEGDKGRHEPQKSRLLARSTTRASYPG